MSNYLTGGAQRRLQTLQRYTQALESGDGEMLGAILAEAGQDEALEQMIQEINASYQLDAPELAASPAEVESAQELLEGLREAAPLPVAAGTPGMDGHRPLTPRSIAQRRAPTQVAGAKEAVPAKGGRARRRWLIAAIAASLVALLLLPNASALANQFLSLFRVQQFQPVHVQDNLDILGQNFLTTLQDFGTLNAQADMTDYPLNASRAQVASHLHFAVRLPATLPPGVGSVAQYALVTGGQATFTFSAAKTRAYLQRTGQSGLHIPTQLDGEVFSIVVKPGVQISFYRQCKAVKPSTMPLSSQDVGFSAVEAGVCSGGNMFSMMEIQSPVIKGTRGDSLSQFKSFALSLKSLSPQARLLLKATDPNKGTVPLPLPPRINARQVTIAGANGWLLTTNTPYKAALWDSYGMVYFILTDAGTNEQLLACARSL